MEPRAAPLIAVALEERRKSERAAGLSKVLLLLMEEHARERTRARSEVQRSWRGVK